MYVYSGRHVVASLEGSSRHFTCCGRLFFLSGTHGHDPHGIMHTRISEQFQNLFHLLPLLVPVAQLMVRV